MADAKKPRLVACRIPTRDGFTMHATYREGENVVYSGVAIEYRPTLQTQAVAFLDDPRDFLIKGRELVVNHVKGWNVAGDVAGDAAPLTPETVAELAYPVLSWMVNCITGYAPKSEADDAKN